MNFAEQLEAKKNLKVIEFANEFLETIKPRLIVSAEKGYDNVRYQINTDLSVEKEKLHLYSNPSFIEHLSKQLDGVKVRYEKKFVENLLFKGHGIGWTKHYLIFEW